MQNLSCCLLKGNAHRVLWAAFFAPLAMAVLRDIRPDLVILDEFQKFREILIDPPNVSPDPVTQALRGRIRAGGHGVLLLSATPYRLYSSRQDEAVGASRTSRIFFNSSGFYSAQR